MNGRGSNQYAARDARRAVSARPDRGLLGQAGAVPPAGHDPQYVKMLKQLAGLDQYDRAVIDVDGTPVAMCFRDRTLPDDAATDEALSRLSRAVSAAAGERPIVVYRFLNVIAIYPERAG